MVLVIAVYWIATVLPRPSLSVSGRKFHIWPYCRVRERPLHVTRLTCARTLSGSVDSGHSGHGRRPVRRAGNGWNRRMLKNASRRQALRVEMREKVVERLGQGRMSEDAVA